MCLQLETLQLSWTMQLVNPIEKTGLPLHRQQLPMGYYFIVIMKAFLQQSLCFWFRYKYLQERHYGLVSYTQNDACLGPFSNDLFCQFRDSGKIPWAMKESKQTNKGICRKRFRGLRKQLQIEPFGLLLTYLGVHIDVLLRAYGHEQYCISHLTQGFSIWGYTEELPEEILKLQVS